MDRRLVLSYLLALLALTACTRERPTPEAVPTLPSSTVWKRPRLTPATESVGSEAAVVDLTAEAPTDNAATPSPEAEATEDVTTFQYIVEPGDTLGGIALEYNVAPEDIRRLNRLFSDEIQVGQPLLVRWAKASTCPACRPPRAARSSGSRTGDTISSIALKFGKDMIELIEANALTESDILSIGQKILIPDYQPTAADLTSSGGSATGSTVATDGVVEHVVQPGETLGTIAEKYGISSAELARANNIANPNLLREGQVLRIPGIDPPTAARLRGETHVVQSGESMSQIALDYGVTVDAILAANELSNPNDLRVGQELVIPAP
ncbi:MAG: LysM peptidoglycan-binding domain-containing protein [Caldilineaceae bacterium]